MHKKYTLFKTVLLLLISSFGFAQQGKITGKITDAETNTALGFSSVRVFSAKDSSLIDGNISNEEGKFTFSLPFGQYHVNVEFMGYESLNTPSISVNAANKNIDLGALELVSSTNSLDEVTVRAEKSSMELSLDKRVFNVGKDLANAGGSAAEVLINIPSVNVAVDGTVSLRGSSNVRILIDGRPSGLVTFKGGAGLQQLQASMVERVEIITNPSARYEAEGMAGIINIILKKDRKQGFNGSFELSTGLPTRYGVAANLNYRKDKLNFFVNYGLSYNVSPYLSELYQEVEDGDQTRILQQDGEGEVTGFNTNVRAGLDYFFSEKSILTASYLLSRANGQRYTENAYQDFINSVNNPIANSLRIQEEDEIEPIGETVVSYKRLFEKKGHELTASFRFLDHSETSDQLFTQTGNLANGQVDPTNTFVQKSLNDEFEKQFLYQLDYIQPISAEGKFEFGARSNFRKMVNDYFVNTVSGSSENASIPELDNLFRYNEQIHAAYAIFGNKQNKISYQAGLRSEWTNIATILEKTNERNPRKYVNLFPSAHLTYDLPKDHAIQLSYSRRIRRPQYNDLSPFYTVSDSRNFFSGNPDLNPEYSDVFELGHVKYFDKGSFTSSIYLRQTDDVIERIRTVDSDGLATTFPENLNSAQAYGIEFTSTFEPTKWWKLDLNVNAFHGETDGTNINETYLTETNSWFARQTSRFTLSNDIKIQFRANYNAPQRGAQDLRKAIYFFDFSASKGLFENKGTLSLSILDILNSRVNRFEGFGPNFTTVGKSQRTRRSAVLTFNYRLNQAD
ncbi:TonB-dependent receptor [uncultured Arcticibacterium sp.]|uniref:TonB-dependent receptor domain-containing protein n=1 Tax=uncultured Arcticibacterium sp. TaxID=2173042 RepID=UPI0030F6B48F